MSKVVQKIKHIVEIILYDLNLGTGHAFHEIMTKISAPLHREAGLDILAFGPSLHDKDTYFLIRAFDTTDQMASVLNTFYNSDDWKNGPRSSILGSIKTSKRSVMHLDPAAISALKESFKQG